MKQKLFSKKTNRLIGLFAFAATGSGLILSTASHETNFYKTEILVIYGCFFAISLADHYKRLKASEEDHEH